MAVSLSQIPLRRVDKCCLLTVWCHTKQRKASRYRQESLAISYAATTSALVPPAIAFFRLSELLTCTEWVSIPRAVNALKTSPRWVWSLIPEVGGGCRDEQTRKCHQQVS